MKSRIAASRLWRERLISMPRHITPYHGCKSNVSHGCPRKTTPISAVSYRKPPSRFPDARARARIAHVSALERFERLIDRGQLLEQLAEREGSFFQRPEALSSFLHGTRAR